MNVHIACIVLKRGGEPVKVDSDIEVHELAEDNRIVYMKNGNLYFSDLKSTSRIGQNITTFYLNKEKNKVLWGEYNAEDHNKYYDYYIRDLSVNHKVIFDYLFKSSYMPV